MTEPIKINIIPHSLMDATYRQLQRMAKRYGIKANLPREELEDALYELLENNRNKTMNDELKFKILQLTSGHYLSATIPNNWYDLTEDQQNEFLTENNWKPFEDYDPEFVWGCIESAAKVTQQFIEDLSEEV